MHVHVHVHVHLLKQWSYMCTASNLAADKKDEQGNGRP